MTASTGRIAARGRIGISATLIVTLAAALSACGDSSSDGAGAQPAATVSSGTSSAAGGSKAEALAQPDAQAAKDAAQAAAGKPAPAPSFTLGLLQYAGAVPVSQELQQQAEAAAKALKVKLVVCDGQGVPPKIAACGESLVNQGVDAILGMSVDASLWRPALEQAKAKKIPVINFGATIAPSDLIVASYVGDPTKNADSMLAWVKSRYAAAGSAAEKKRKVAIASFPSIFTEAKTKVIEDAAGDEHMDVVAKWNIDATKIDVDTRQKVNAALTQHSDLGLVWSSFAPSGAPAGQVVASRFPGKSFPDRPLVISTGQDPSVLGAIRDGQLDASVEDPYYATAWMAVDQFAQHFARHQKIDTDPGLSKYKFPFYSYRALTKDNVPAQGGIPSISDYKTFFTTKWGLEFR